MSVYIRVELQRQIRDRFFATCIKINAGYRFDRELELMKQQHVIA